MRKAGGYDAKKYKPKNPIVDDTLLDDDTRRMLMQEVMRAPPPRLSQAGQQTSSTDTTLPPATRPSVPAVREQQNAKDEADLMSVMAQRLKALETKVSVLQKELREKNVQVISLEDRLKAERSDRKEAQAERDMLAQELEEVHDFLDDYGLTWVGKPAPVAVAGDPGPAKEGEQKSFDLYAGNFAGPAKEIPPEAKPDTADAQTNAEPPKALPFSMTLLQQQAERLTAAIGNTGLTGDQVKMIKEREVVHVCVYRDGLVVNSGPLRPYGWPLCTAFLDDLLEGFYPYEFKDRYPDGFPLNIIDRSTEMCPKNAAPKPSGPVSGTIEDVNEHGYKPLTRSQFLKKLPERYITASGQIVNVRDGVSQNHFGGTANPTSPMKTISGATAAGAALQKDPGAPDVAAVQIKLPKGQKVVLHMFFTDTIAETRAELGKAAPFFTEPKYELCTVFPRKTYDDHSLTLKELGLVPNCTLLVKLPS